MVVAFEIFLLHDFLGVNSVSWLYELQNVPKKIAPKIWVYLMMHYTWLVSEIYFKTFFYRGLFIKWPLKILTKDISYIMGNIKLKSK